MIDLHFPESTRVNKVVPKTAFYKNLEVNAHLRQHFVEDVERIVWLAKLAPSTLNVEDGKTVHEITVFHVLLKAKEVPDDVFTAIDRQMPRHILFVLQYEEECRLLLNYKEWIDADKGTFRILKAFQTDWCQADTLSLQLEGTNLDRIYESFAGQVSGFGTHNAADTKRIIELQKQLALKKRSVEALQKKVRAEKQYNRQVQLNSEARQLKRELASLQDEIDKLKQ
ncbi:hypothetical protein EVA_20396, partial [gut metagenome]